MDISELEQRVEELEFENKLLMRAQDSVMIVFDENGVITLSNNPARLFFNVNKIIGKTYKKVVKIPEVLKLIKSAEKSGEYLKKEVIIVQESDSFQLGEERCLSISVKPLKGEVEGNFTRVLIFDNTDQHRVDQVRKDFLANASHELRTPLAIINGYVETLMDKDVLSETDTSIRFLGIMKKHGARLAQIIEEMLIISKLESDDTNTLKLSSFRVKDLVEDVLVNLDSFIKENKVKVKIKMSEPNLSIEADRFYWYQIIFNLMENAIKQNPKKKLNIKVGCTQCKSGDVKIWISDDGVGIPASDLPYIFRRFYRVEKHHSQKKIKGTGLGLSIVKRAVEAHGGTIVCDSVQGQLTRFTVRLPKEARVDDIAEVA